MSGLPLAALVEIFVGAAALIWVAGVQLSDQTDVLATRLRLGSALGGLVLLAIATNLPEIAITVSAAASGNTGVAVGNILGGIALQTVVLVVLDVFGVRGRRPLTYRAASLVLVLEGALVVGVLALVVAGTQLPEDLVSTTRAAVVFAVAALATLVAGVVLERSGDAIAGHIGLTGVLFGATVLAAATSLPEVSTGLTSVRHGDFQLAVSDIFGGNAFLPVLFLLASLVSGQAVLPQAHDTDIYLTAVAVVLTLAYMTGLLFRPGRRIARMGVDSLVVLVVYAVSVVGLLVIAGG